MNHQHAVASKATERYLLNELDAASRAAFEEHYFSCHSCADDVKTAVQFVDNAKAVLTPRADRAAAAAPRAWVKAAVPAALAACVAIGYYLPHPANPRDGLVTTAAVPAGPRETASAGPVLLVDKDAAYFLVRLDVADAVTAPRLLWRVRAAGGRELRFLTVRENQATLPLPAADFPVGQYEVLASLDSPDAPVIDRFPFAIRRQ